MSRLFTLADVAAMNATAATSALSVAAFDPRRGRQHVRTLPAGTYTVTAEQVITAGGRLRFPASSMDYARCDETGTVFTPGEPVTLPELSLTATPEGWTSAVCYLHRGAYTVACYWNGEAYDLRRADGSYTEDGRRVQFLAHEDAATFGAALAALSGSATLGADIDALCRSWL